MGVGCWLLCCWVLVVVLLGVGCCVVEYNVGQNIYRYNRKRFKLDFIVEIKEGCCDEKDI